MINKVDSLTNKATKGADHDARMDSLEWWEAAGKYHKREEHSGAVILDPRDKLDKATIRQDMHAQHSECYNHRLEILHETSQDNYALLKRALRECADYGRQEAFQKEDIPQKDSITARTRKRNDERAQEDSFHKGMITKLNDAIASIKAETQHESQKH